MQDDYDHAARPDHAMAEEARTMTRELSVLQLGESLAVTRCLGRIPGIRLHVLSKDPWPIDRFSRYVSSCGVYREDGDRAMSTIYDGARRVKADVIVPTVASPTRFVSVHRHELSRFVAIPPSPNVDAFDLEADKWLLSGYLAEHEIDQPRTILCARGEALEDGLRDLAFPVLLKPRQDLAGGRGIRCFEKPARVRSFLDEHPEYLGGYVIQSYVEGYDISCNVLCRDGNIMAHTIQKARVPSRKEYSPAAVIEFVDEEGVLDLVARLVSALGWSGVANVDLRYDQRNDGFKILEFNPRYWTSLLGSLHAGVNFPYLHCLAGVGVPFLRPRYAHKRYVVKETINQLRKRSYAYEGRVRLRRDEMALRASRSPTERGQADSRKPGRA